MGDILNFPLLIAALQNEEERLENNQRKKNLRNTSDPLDLPEIVFKSVYRFNKDTARYLIDEIGPFIPDPERNELKIPKSQIILCALHFYAQGTYQKSTGQDMNCPMSQSSVSRCIDMVTDILNEHFGYKVKFPQNDGEKNEEKIKFFNIFDAFPGERPYKCELCNKTFIQDGDLKRHISIHSGEKQFQCQHCGKQYFTKAALATHISIHEGAKKTSNIDCNICEKTFDECGHNTVSSSHKGYNRKYLCTICGKSFTASGSLKVHTRIHTGETPFTCTFCNKGYNNSSALKRHVIRNHSEEKTHICMICHKSFHDSSNLKRHVKRVHSVVEMKLNYAVSREPDKLN